MQKDEIKQNKMKEYYNSSCYFEKAKHNFPGSKNRFNKYMIKNVFKIYYPQKNEKILDMGCGWGNISLVLQKEKFNITGLDYSTTAIDICKKSAKKLNLDDSKFICKNATDTGLESESFDVIYCADLVEHLYPKIYNDLTKEAHRILKRGGKFVIYTPNPQHIFEILRRYDIILKKAISHVDYKTMDRLIKSLNENDFSIKKSFYIESHIPFFNNIEKILIPIIPILRRRTAILAIKN